MKYAWIQEQGDSFPVALMCNLLSVSRSGYYASIDREPSPRAQRQQRIWDSVRQVHAETDGIYGSYKIAKVLCQQLRRPLAYQHELTGFALSCETSLYHAFSLEMAAQGVYQWMTDGRELLELRAFDGGTE